jgi:F-type H+-transporting ATPase subunit delta
LNFVIDKGREEILPEILEKFETLKDESLGIVKVNVTTAFDFTSEQRNHLQQQFESYLKKKARLTYKVDTNIIGGFIAKVGDTVYNASMIHQLGLLKKEFLQGSVTLN